ncbi:MAG: twin-arginine translocase TatA/TatE family subunit [Gemmatimonadaceae bacterium]
MFENLSLPHILMVLVIVMLLFGAKRIPEIAGSMGKGIKEFKRNINDATRDESASTGRVSAGSPSESLNRREPEEERRAEPKRLS